MMSTPVMAAGIIEPDVTPISCKRGCHHDAASRDFGSFF
jgi:hypothetical protein